MKNQAVVAKMINHKVTGNRFIDKPVDEYIYASLSQPPVKIIDKCGSDDEMDYIVECPNCGSYVNYGEHIYMLSGYIYCDTKGCFDMLFEKHPRLKEKYPYLGGKENE